MSIETGVYRIRNVYSGTYFDASQMTEYIHGWDRAIHGANQKWLVEKTDDGYILRTMIDDKYAYAPNNATGTKLVSSRDLTYWDIVPKSGGYAIRVHGTDQTVDLDYGKSSNGASIALYPASNQVWQIWHFEPITGPRFDGQHIYKGPNYTCDIQPGTYIIRNISSWTVLDLTRGESAEETPVIGHSSNGGDNQKWIVEADHLGFKFKNVASGTYLGTYDVQEFQNGIPLWGSKYGVQLIVRKPKNDADGYEIFHPAANYVVDLDHGYKADATKVWLWSLNNGSNQRWHFEAI